MKTATEILAQLVGTDVFRGASPAVVHPGDCFVLKDEFLSYTDAQLWTKVAGSGAAAAVGNEVGGVLALSTAATDNNPSFLRSTAKLFKFAVNKPLWFEARVKLTEGNTDDANALLGLCSVGDATLLGNDGAGPPANYDGALFFKVDGGTAWQFEVSKATAQETDTDVGDVGSGEWVRLGFRFEPDAGGTTGTITPYVNGRAGTARQIALSGLGEMYAVAGAKSGGTNAESLKVDWILVAAAR